MEEPEEGLGRTDDRAHGIPTAGTGMFLSPLLGVDACHKQYMHCPDGKKTGPISDFSLRGHSPWIFLT